jgi:hypothetical protein
MARVEHKYNKTFKKQGMISYPSADHTKGSTGAIYLTEEEARKDEKLFLYYFEKRKPRELQVLAPPGRLNWKSVPGN